MSWSPGRNPNMTPGSARTWSGSFHQRVGRHPKSSRSRAESSIATDTNPRSQASSRRARKKHGTYWMLRFGVGFDEARPGNILLTDGDLNVLAGDGVCNPGNRFHLWIYRERAEINAIVHTHAPNASALSMIGEPLIVAHGYLRPLRELRISRAVARRADRRRGRRDHRQRAG
jgi:ribulose-5-phosphate 4-epimerase/fuculose-1-phosphate aldolase